MAPLSVSTSSHMAVAAPMPTIRSGRTSCRPVGVGRVARCAAQPIAVMSMQSVGAPKSVTVAQFSGLRRITSAIRCRRVTKHTMRATTTCELRAPLGADVVPVADMDKILAERDGCGVGIIANLAGDKSHKVIQQALTGLGCMEHRGGCSADDDSGDGAGVMVQIPWKVIAKWAKAEKVAYKEECSGAGNVFFPNDEASAKQARAIVVETFLAEGLKVVGWRKMPLNLDVVGKFAKATQPIIEQVIVESTTGRTGDDLERQLYVGRKLVERQIKISLAKYEDFYFCTLSSRTIVYKGMLRSVVVGEFYLDLKDTDFETSFAIYHRRFSTNTTPKWPLAQPMRVLGHNGEINTLQGNLNWMASREAIMTHPVWDGREPELRPITDSAISDSGNLDRVAELLVLSETPMDQTLLMLVPEAYRNHPTLDSTYPEAKAFYDFYAGMQEAWDGPALLCFSDGKTVGARLDRNGLRPARFWRTADGFLYVASEVGVFGDVLTDAANVVYKGRLGPGMMVTAELGSGEFNVHADICKKVAMAKPYAKWLEQVTRPEGLDPVAACTMSAVECLKVQAATGFSGEDLELVIQSMAVTGIEPTYCMGDDTPLPVLASSPHLLYDYFKQRFAQVTNPAIDPLREGLVMSLEVHLGARGNILMPDASSIPKVVLDYPAINDTELKFVQDHKDLNTVTIPCRFKAGGGAGALKAALEDICEQAAKAVEAGAQVVVLSDRAAALDSATPAIPSLLAVGCVHHHLIQVGLRLKTSIISDTASAFSPHHVAVLLGYGASAVCPFLALESCRQFEAAPRTRTLMKNGKLPALCPEEMQDNLIAAQNKGVKKILSKMGISLLSSYTGAQIFEIYGLGKEVVDIAFKGSISRIGGLSLDEIATEVELFWKNGFPEADPKKLANFGFYSVRPGLEYHGNNGEMSKILHKAIGLGGNSAQPEVFELYREYQAGTPVSTPRDALTIVSDRKPISVEEVESAEKILGRFCTGGMSLGAISRECHETIAVAMNRIGGKSNSGEGGEDVKRFDFLTDVDADGKSATFPHLGGMKNGDIAFSKIKQVASGRFGVTPHFLMNCEQLEIKVSQGAKPGEGGQLPGQKVSPYIAELRASKPGVPLISPPPHHDIYSIEDLAQLIYDLHMINPSAKVSVKLVAEAGIGTVASGVAKAGADVIQVSGHDGGTGASPISSIKHAGGPWEMGLTESHTTLTMNHLRDRVVLRADGGFKSGQDVMMAALMGADEYGFGTVAMIATGCIMARICHTNNCPVGVASQREELRARMPGVPGDVVNFFIDVANEVRGSLAALGYTSMDEIIGRSDLLKQDVDLTKTNELDLSFLTAFVPEKSTSTQRRTQEAHSNGPCVDDELLANKDLMKAIEEEGTFAITLPVNNVDRSIAARVSGQVAKRYGNRGFAGAINLTFEGSAGQSFGVFMCGGINIKLIGEANDYVGKGIAGGEIVIVPPPGASFDPSVSCILGNTCLYGATGGRLHANGTAGERFAVRNSAAEAVVEGAGDHCCEYMTGGVVVVLGEAGRNIGAGMTGGLAYFLDEEDTFLKKVNGEIVRAQRIQSKVGEQQLKSLIKDHLEKTGSARAKQILGKWDEYLPKFWQVVPPSEKNTPEVEPEQTEPAKLEAVAK